MLKRKNNNEINPDTFIYSVPVFRVVKNTDGIDKVAIYIRVTVENQLAFFIMIDKNGQYYPQKFSTDTTFRRQWGNTYTVYECAINNIDVEYY